MYCLFSAYGLNRKRNVSIFKKKLANTACGPGRGMTHCVPADQQMVPKNPWRPHRPHKPTPHSPPGPGWCWDLQGQRRHVGRRGVEKGDGHGPWITYLQPIFSPKDHRLKLQLRQKTVLQEMEVTTDHERDQKNIHSERVQKMTPTRPFIASWSLLKNKRNSNIFKCNLPALHTTFLSDKFQCLLEPFQGLGLLSIEKQVFLAIPALDLKLFNRKSLNCKDY